MTEDDDPFGDLGDDLGDDVQPANDVDVPDTPTDRDESEQESGRDEVDSETRGALSDRPAFEYDAVQQRPLYARPEAWESFEDVLDFDVRRALRDDGLRDVPKRELHDAALRVLEEHGEEIAEAVKENRRL